MRLLALLVFSLSSWVAAHAHPVRIDLERPVQPDLLWADEVFMTGTDRVTLIATMGASPERPALWRAFDPKGRELWRREHTCPDFSDLAMVVTLDDRAVCKLGHEVMAIDVATGKERWRYSDPRRMYMMAGAQGRLAVSANNEELLVFDVKAGKVVLRLDTPGATFEEVAPTPDGPVALFIQDPPGKVDRAVELDLGNGPQRVVVSGIDADRRLIGVPIGGTSKTIEPATPRWSVPFEGYSFEVIHSGGAIITEPSQGLRVAWDPSTGERLWDQRLLDEEVVAFGNEGGVFAVPTAKGWLYGAFDTRTGKPRWHDPRSFGVLPSAVSQSAGQAVFITDHFVDVRAYVDGGREISYAIPEGYVAKAARATAAMAVWVIQREDERTVFVRAR